MAERKVIRPLNANTERDDIQPKAGKLLENSEVRIYIFGNYSIVYELAETEIQIAPFWENHQNPEN
jgi:hypothetical protein